MTNPNNAIGTNGAYGGRTSVDAFNDDLAMFSTRGVVSGFAVSPDSGLTVSLGGDGTSRDVAVAEDNIGNKTTINNISKSPISVTISGAPANNSRVDAIVAYVEKPAQGTSTAVDNPGACGLIVVEGTTASTPVAPDDSAIRTAITADGAGGTVAYYVILGYVTIPAGTTTITSNMISQGDIAPLQSDLVAIPDGSITGAKIASGTVEANNIKWSSIEQTNFKTTVQEVGKWIDNKTIYRAVFTGTVSSGGDENGKVIGTISDSIDNVVSINTIGYTGSSDRYATSQTVWTSTVKLLVQVDKTTGNVTEYTGTAFGSNSITIVVEYTKN